MKKNIKSLLGLGLAVSMAFASTVSSLAADQSFKLTGTIAGDDLTINLTLPTDSTLTIKPFGKDQISTEIAYFESGFADADAEGAVAYDVSLLGYTATATSKTADNLITLLTAPQEVSAYTGVKKEVAMSIQVGAAADDKVTEAEEFKALFADPVIDVVLAKKSEADYTAGGTYTALKEETPTVVTIKPAEVAPFRVTGTMNPSAAWEEGDAINVTPIFKVVPNVTAE